MVIGEGTAAERTVTIPYSYPRGNYRTMVYALVGGGRIGVGS